jgi:hypothetical protein
MMVHMVEISEATYNRLLRRAVSFGDSPEDVIVRLLDAAGTFEGSSVQNVQQDIGGHHPTRPRAVPGSILPEREYWRPILEILDERGGAAPASEVMERLGERMNGVLTPRDYEDLSMGEVRWRNRARFARLRMTEQGLLSRASHRGIWELTDAGREYLDDGRGASDPGSRSPGEASA